MKNLKLHATPLLSIVLFFLHACGDNIGSEMTNNEAELKTISFKDLSQKAYEYLEREQELANNVYHINDYEHWQYDQLTGELTFSDSGVKKLIIDYEEVGSISFKSNTWLWAWENPHLEWKVKSEIGMVRAYGRKRGFEKLANPKWTADLYDGWEMTAIAAYLMKAKGAYRVPSSDSLLYSFMIFKNIRWADSAETRTP